MVVGSMSRHADRVSCRRWIMRLGLSSVQFSSVQFGLVSVSAYSSRLPTQFGSQVRVLYMGSPASRWGVARYIPSCLDGP